MKKPIIFITSIVLLQITNCILSTISCAQKIECGDYSSLAICSDSTVSTWGWNLGNGNDSSSNIPVQVSFLTGIIVISGGFNHCLVLKNDGTVWSWGDNTYGQLGDGTNIGSNVPVQLSSP